MQLGAIICSQVKEDFLIPGTMYTVKWVYRKGTGANKELLGNFTTQECLMDCPGEPFFNNMLMSVVWLWVWLQHVIREAGPIRLSRTLCCDTSRINFSLGGVQSVNSRTSEHSSQSHDPEGKL